MPDQPFYSPTWKPQAAKPRAPGKLLWELRHDHATWSCELRFHGESYGWEAMMFREGELFYSQRFMLRALAVRHAEEQRRLVERGWV